MYSDCSFNCVAMIYSLFSTVSTTLAPAGEWVEMNRYFSIISNSEQSISSIGGGASKKKLDFTFNTPHVVRKHI